MMGAAETGHVVMIVGLMVSSLLNIAYLLGPVARGFFFPAKEIASGETLQVSEAPFWCVAPPMFAAIGCVVLFFYAGEIESFLAPLIAGNGVSG